MNRGQAGTLSKRNGQYDVLFRDLDGKKTRVYVGPVSMGKIAAKKKALEIVQAAIDPFSVMSPVPSGVLSGEQKNQITFEMAATSLLHGGSTRNRKRWKAATIANFTAYAKKLNPIIGALPLIQITNGTCKKLVTQFSHLAPKTQIELIGVVKKVVASVVDPETGEQVYPRKWNHEFMDLPELGNQKQDCFTREQVGEILKRAGMSTIGVYCALLAGTGLRAAEGQSIMIGPETPDHSTISCDCRTIYINKSIWRKGIEQAPKTKAAIRIVDVPDEVAGILKAYIGNRTSGFVFATSSGRPKSQRNLMRSLHSILLGTEKKSGVTGKSMGFHAFRRFRVTHLSNMSVPEDMVRFWVGHGNKDITARYVKQKENVQMRKHWCEQAGLGFDILAPATIELELEQVKA